MNPTTVAIFVPVLVASLLIVIFGAVYLVSSRMKKRLMAEAQLRFDLNALLKGPDMANFFGLKSKGMSQVRGLGLLILSGDQLWFKLGMPSREFTVPLKSIRSLSTPKSFLGKSKGRKLLCVHFDTPNGGDEIAFLVRDLEGWHSAVEQVSK